MSDLEICFMTAAEMARRLRTKELSAREVVAATSAAMEEASRAILAGFTVRAEAKVVWSPGRYGDKRGVAVWERICGLAGIRT